MMLHSFGLRFRPWTDYSEAFRAEMNRRTSVEFQDHSLLNARRNSDKSDASFVEDLRSLNVDQPRDLIVAIGAPAANFVQAHRKDLFATTPMLFTAIEQRRVDFDKLSEYDTVVASSNDDYAFFENILRVLPLTTTIAIVIGASPSETILAERGGQVHRAVGRPRAVRLHFPTLRSIKAARRLPSRSSPWPTSGMRQSIEPRRRRREEEMPDVIDFESKKNRRDDARFDTAIAAEAAKWENIRARLTGILATSTGRSLMVSAGLAAMLDVLEDSGLSRRDAKAYIVKGQRAFYPLQGWEETDG